MDWGQGHTLTGCAASLGLALVRCVPRVFADLCGVEEGSDGNVGRWGASLALPKMKHRADCVIRVNLDIENECRGAPGRQKWRAVEAFTLHGAQSCCSSLRSLARTRC